jgi:hypothetical protein
MTRLLPLAGAALALATSLPAAALNGADTSTRLTCNVSGMYADGTRISGSGSEDIAIEIRGGSNDIRVTSNGRTRQAALLRGTSERLAFAYAADALVDGNGMMLSLLYELRLDSLRLKRTVTPLFTSQVGPLQAAESNCVRTGAAAAPAAAAPAAAPAAAATATPAGPTPDWLVEFRRKLKECGTKDPISQMTCTERMKARYCTNRPAGIPECEGN